MGNAYAKDPVDEKISRSISADEKSIRRTFTLLLLGASNCGKTTFLKQMRVINATAFSSSSPTPFSADELLAFKLVIFRNIFDGIRRLLKAMRRLGIEVAREENGVVADWMSALRFDQAVDDHDSTKRLGRDFALKLSKLWKDEGVQRCFSRRNEFHLDDSLPYFLERLEELVVPDYVPTVDHVLRARSVTDGVNSRDFLQPSGQLLRVVDVGGQRGQRAKWLPLFDAATAIVFVASLADFNQTLVEDPSVNCLEESLFLFRFILSLDYFANTPVILFLNKTDLLLEKLDQRLPPKNSQRRSSKQQSGKKKSRETREPSTPQQQRQRSDATAPRQQPPKPSSFSARFPEYKADDFEGEMKEAQFVRSLFVDCQSGENRRVRSIYTHFTCATDTDNIKKVWSNVRDIIFSRVVREESLQ